MIYLCPEIRSSLGEDTFWTWFHREIPSSFDLPAKMNEDDVLLQYSTLGPSRIRGGRKVALLWELHPEMLKQGVLSGRSEVIERIHACAHACDLRVIASPIMREFYKDVHELPIGVDERLFCPRPGMREKYGFSGEVGIWVGTPHHMKGADRLIEYAKIHPEIQFIAVWKKSAIEVPKNVKNYVRITQQVLSDLMNCADFMLGTSRLRPFYMAEWEALCTGLPYRNISGLDKDFEPGEHPRLDVLRLGWDRTQAKQKWMDFLASH